MRFRLKAKLLRVTGHVDTDHREIIVVFGWIPGWCAVILSLSETRALRMAQGRGPFNSDATALLRHRNM